MIQYSIIEKEITAGSPAANWGDIKANANVSHYYIYSGVGITLSDDWIITETDTPQEGQELTIYFNGDITLNGHVITILGYTFNQNQARRKNKLFCRYENNAWEVYLMESYDEFNFKQPGVEEHYINQIGDILLIDRNINESYIVLYETLYGQNQTGDYIVSPTGTFQDGDEFWISYEANLTYNGGVVTVFGETLTAVEAMNKVLFYAKYDYSQNIWHTYKLVGAGNGTLVDGTTIDFDVNNQLYSMLWQAGTGSYSVQSRNYGANASGGGSVAIGKNTKANGLFSFAGGISVAQVNKILATGSGSFAFGYVQTTGEIEAGASATFAGGFTQSQYDIRVLSPGSLAWLMAYTRDCDIMDTQSSGSFISGRDNVITSISPFSALIGGNYNTITGASESGILGGTENSISNIAGGGGILGGLSNSVEHAYSVILGGSSVVTRAEYTAYAEFLDFKDPDSIYAESIRDTNAYNLVSPVAPRAHFLLDEVAILATKLDDWAEPDDNTDLNVSTARHGLTPKLPNDATKYLDGTGLWTVPAGTGTGEANDGNNTGLGAGVFKNKTGVTLNFKSLVAANVITIDTNADDLVLGSPDWGKDPGDFVEIGSILNGNSVVITDVNQKLKTEDMKTAFNKDFAGSGVALTVAHSDHTHTGIDANPHASTHEAGNTDAINGDALEVSVSMPFLNPAGTTIGQYFASIEAFVGKLRYGTQIKSETGPVTFSTPFANTNYIIFVRGFNALGETVNVDVVKGTTGFTAVIGEVTQVEYLAIAL